MSTISISIDTEAEAAYVRFSDREVARTVELSPSTLVDVADDGTAIGVEILGPGGTIPRDALTRDFGVDKAVVDHLANAIPHIA